MYLNGCLKTGLQSQNLIWDVVIQSRFGPILKCGTIKKTLLQIKIRKGVADVLQMHWHGKVIKAIEKNMYADDLRAGGNTSDGVSYSMQLFKKRGFNLHKCNSNVSKLQNNNSSPN